MKNLAVRALSGSVFVAIMVFCTVYSLWTLRILLALLAVLGVKEFLTLVGEKGLAPQHDWLTALVAAVPLLLGLSISAIVLCLLLALLVFAAARMLGTRENPIRCLGVQALALFYVVFPLLAIWALTQSPLPLNGSAFWVLPLAMYVMLWVNDTFAYLTGSLLGRHKLIPSVSPGKTWEGCIGGAVFAMGAGALTWHFFPDAMSLPQWIGMALVVVVFGTLGDLVESMFKRSLGVKDSGHLIPGHGGILDRIDSMLFAAPATVAYLFIVVL